METGKYDDIVFVKPYSVILLNVEQDEEHGVEADGLTDGESPIGMGYGRACGGSFHDDGFCGTWAGEDRYKHSFGACAGQAGPCMATGLCI